LLRKNKTKWCRNYLIYRLIRVYAFRVYIHISSNCKQYFKISKYTRVNDNIEKVYIHKVRKLLKTKKKITQQGLKPQNE